MEIKLGENIKELRKNSGHTQEDLAEAVGVSSQAVSRWESGNGFPDISLLPDIAEFFGVTLDELMYDSKLTRERLQERYHNLFLSNSDPKERLTLARSLAKWNAQPYILELLYQNYNVTEEARTLSKEYLKTADIYGRTLLLGELIRLEDEDKLGIWLDYLPTNTPWGNTLHKALMGRYMDSPHDDPEKYTRAMQDTLRDAIWDIDMCLCGYGKDTKEGLVYLLDLLTLSAPNPRDAFCKDRISVLLKLARLAFSEGEKEASYRYLTEAAELCEWLFSHDKEDEISFSHGLFAGKTVQAAYLQSPIVITVYYGRRIDHTEYDSFEQDEQSKQIIERIVELCRQANQAIFLNL